MDDRRQILVETLSGKTLVIPAKASATIAMIKGKIQEKERIPPAEQNLVLSSKVLEDDSKTLHDYDIKQGTTLRLFRL